MTLQEMSEEYKQQADRVKARMRALAQARRESRDETEQTELAQRIRELTPIWRETREQATLLAHYYERGYRRNGKYTI
jgi:hypothetical protein